MSRRKLRILALMDETLVPPEETGDADLSTVPWKTEFDVTSTLRELGHEVLNLGVASDLAPIRHAIETLEPHIVFNLIEDFHDIPI
jgi:D-alanine-D-alanine ligase